MNFYNIPAEMHLFNQWVLWRFEDRKSLKPTKTPYSVTGQLANINDSATWSNFKNVVHIFETSKGIYDGIGFVLTKNDPYCFIDLDDPNEQLPDGSFKYSNPQAVLNNQLEIYKSTKSYAERSPSGKGLHVICKGEIPSGRKRGAIEIYSSARYMTMTGEIYRNAEIENENEFANILFNRLGSGSEAVKIYAGCAEEKESDEIILEKAYKAQNGEKFYKLYTGEWQDLYASQSEADFALIDIVAFYTQNRKQIARIFRNSALGQREKAKRVDYVNYMLNKSFDRMLPPVDIEGLQNQLNAIIEQKVNKELQSQKSLSANIETKEIKPLKIKESSIDVPPGLVGEIAQFVFSQSPRPVPEIALSAAIGLMAGIVGRSYNILGTGLNQYILLLATTGAGKEAISSGIDKIMQEVIKSVPASVDFIGPSEMASSQAVIKYMSKGKNCFLSLVGEFGLRLQEMSKFNAPAYLVSLRRFILDIYNKSGEGKVLRPSIYSDSQNSTNSVFSPAFSLLGDSTPEKFYEGLNEGLINEGLVPRFTIIEYNGNVVPLNENHNLMQPSFQLIEKVSSLCAHSLMLNGQSKAISVDFSQSTKVLSKALEEKCRNLTNNCERDFLKHLWSRVHMKVLKLSSIVAVGCNPYDPIITDEILNWSAKIILDNTNEMIKHFEIGDVGIDNDEMKQIAAAIKVIKDYLTLPESKIEKYIGKSMLHLYNAKIIPFSFFQRKLISLAAFRKDRIGATNAIKKTISSLIDRGDLQEISKAVLAKDYNTHARAFMISNLDSFEL